MATALEHCDMVAAVLCGITDPAPVPRSICAMGHKWMWNQQLGGLPPEEFLTAVDPLLAGVRDKLGGRVCHQRPASPGTLSPEWAREAGPARRAFPIPTGAFDAHWDAIGAGCRIGDVVNVVGTSTCIMAITRRAGADPRRVRRGAGLDPSRQDRHRGGTLGDRRHLRCHRADAPARRSRSLSTGLENYRAGQTGLLRLTWDNGDRTVLVNPELSGVTLGWRLTHTAQDELFAAIEGHGVPHARHPGAHGGARRAGAAHHQRRRHPAEERRAEPGVRQRDGQADPGARTAM